ncbi:MAG: ABC transporter ATP-binding protein [Aquificae bacterium]|nr:ABC transporter ATP-binding protein [Aquificota bacterium]
MLLVEDLEVRAGNFLLRVEKLSLRRGEVCAILGPSGSGKSTLLETVAGLRKPLKGSLKLGGRDLTHLPPERRAVALVYQDHLLFPHLTVFENLAFGLRKKVKDEAALRAEVLKAARELGISHLLEAKPDLLSGGERQRVALGRALLAKPSLLLLDEPTAALDPPTRSKVRTFVLETLKRRKVGALWVTHDADEALSVGQKVLFLHRGRVLQVGTPREVLELPAHPAVALFLKGNLLRGRVKRMRGNLAEVEVEGRTLLAGRYRTPPAPGQKVWLYFRPERVKFVKGPNLLKVRAVGTYREGYSEVVLLRLGKRELRAVLPQDLPKKPPAEVEVSIDPEEVLVAPLLADGEDFVP